MNIRAAIITAMIGLSLDFLLRTIATFAPGSMTNEAVAKAAIGVHLFSAAAMLWFFVAFFQEVARPLRSNLRDATVLAAAGAAIAVLLPLQTLLRIYLVAPFSTFVRSPWLEPLAPLVATLCILIFFAVYRRDLDKGEKPILYRPTSAALAAYVLFTILNLVVLALHMTTGQLRWLTEMGPLIAFVTLPVVAAGLAGVLYFFVSLRRFLGSQPD